MQHRDRINAPLFRPLNAIKGFFAVLAFFALVLNVRSQGTAHFAVELTSTADPNRSFGGGTLTLNGSKLTYFLRVYERLVSPEIRGPAAPGMEMPLLFTLNRSSGAADEPPISYGEVVLTLTQTSQLNGGQLYVTGGRSPASAYRGQIVPNVGCHEGSSTPIFLSAILSGDGAGQATFWDFARLGNSAACN
jgi:hypothetical protein